jgi:hypothetical protein
MTGIKESNNDDYKNPEPHLFLSGKVIIPAVSSNSLLSFVILKLLF